MFSFLNSFGFIILAIVIFYWIVFLIIRGVLRKLRTLKNKKAKTEHSNQNVTVRGHPEYYSKRYEQQRNEIDGTNSALHGSDQGVGKATLSDGDRVQAGICGEQRVKSEISKISDGVTSFHDIKFHFDGKNYQIDHVVISHNAMFVLETKHYKEGSTLEQCGRRNISRKTSSDDVLTVRNPYDQLVWSCRAINDVIYKDLGTYATLQPLVVYVNRLNHQRIASNIPAVFLFQLRSFIYNYYTPYKLQESKRAALVKLCARLKSGEMCPLPPRNGQVAAKKVESGTAEDAARTPAE